MAGVINGHVVLYNDGSIELLPEVCPCAGPHRLLSPRCYSIMFDGTRRACPYWHATTRLSNFTERIDASGLADELVANAGNLKRCSVICHAARRNRPPGC